MAELNQNNRSSQEGDVLNLSTENCEVDVLNISFQNTSIDDDTPLSVDAAECFVPCTSSTPLKSSKHRLSLNPSEFEPPKKKSNLSKMRSEMQNEDPGKVASHADVLNVLGTDNKNLATRSVKQVFSSAVSDRRKGVYRNIRRSISYESSTDGSSYEVATNSEIYGLQQQVISHKEKANALMATIKSSVNDPYASSLISLYNKEMDCVSKLSDNIDIMYENELKYLLEHEKVLDPSEKSCLVEEFKKWKHLLTWVSEVGRMLLRCGKNSEGKDVDEESSDISEGDDDNDSGNEDGEQTDRNRVSGPETTVNAVQTLFRKQDCVFNSTFDSLKNKLWNAIQTTTLERFIKEISETEHLRTIRDHLGRSLLHMAVE
ncbi:Hypothetical predicted protein [Paramuricea clavata]|uniref:Uncharacterized protein n=1 Tax=Paramuricea clavata TaxID=317549 RepID=A0A6S7GG44_PARCT|nr:Hypothetical predicted protein [Paramuricea clavata]